MGLQQQIIAVLCAVAVIANPLMAASQPCCCTQKQLQRQASHCDQQPVTTAGKSCCAKPRLAPEPQRVALVRPCGCCVKAAPQPLPSRSLLVKPVPPIDWVSWDAPQLGPLVATFGQSRLDVRAFPNVGPALLAVLCRWLK